MIDLTQLLDIRPSPNNEFRRQELYAAFRNLRDALTELKACRECWPEEYNAALTALDPSPDLKKILENFPES